MYTAVMSEQGVLYVRIPQDMKDALQSWADEEVRPLNFHVTKLLQDALRAAGRWPGKAP